MESLEMILEDKGRAVYRIGPGATVLDAVDLMCARHVGAVLVCRDDEPVGIFSERDLMRRVILARLDPATTRLEDVMTRDLVCVTPATSPNEAMGMMTRQRCRHLPVTQSGRVVGMISIGDLVRHVSRVQEHEIQMLHEYVNSAYPG